MTDNTFTRVDLTQFDGITDGPWEVGRPNAGPVSGTIPVHTPGYDSDGYRDGALVCSVYGTATRSAANSRAIASVPRFIAALRRAYAEIDRLQSQLIAVQEDAMTIYGDNDRLTAEIDRLTEEADRRLRAYQDSERFIEKLQAEHGQTRTELADAADGEMLLQAEIDRLRAELNGAWMESGHDKATIDRLRANALEWTAVTDDPATLPEEYRNVIVKMRKGRGDGYTAAFRDGDQWAVTQHQKRGGLEACSMFSVSPGDRWAYIPEVQA